MQGDIPCLLKVTGFAFTLESCSEEMSEALTLTLPKYPGVGLFQSVTFAPVAPCAFVQSQSHSRPAD